MVQRPNMNHAAKDMPSDLPVILDSAMSTTALVPLTASRRQFIYNRPRPKQQELWSPLLGSITLYIRFTLFIARSGCHAIWCCARGMDPDNRLFNLIEHCRLDAAWQHLLHDPLSTYFLCPALSTLLLRCLRLIFLCTEDLWLEHVVRKMMQGANRTSLTDDAVIQDDALACPQRNKIWDDEAEQHDPLRDRNPCQQV